MPAYFLRSLLFGIAFTALFGAPSFADDVLPLETQAIKLLRPNYISESESTDQLASVDHNIYVIGQPAFEEWHPPTRLHLPTAPLKAATLYVLALGERDQQDAGMSYDVELGLFAVQDGKITLVVSGEIGDPQLVVEQGSLGAVALDLTPYKISDDETAFGVKIESTYDASSEHVTGTNLYLLRPTQDGIIPIFNAPIAEDESSDIVEKEGPISNVTVQHHKTLGFYNIRLRSGAKSTKFVWSGSYYENPETLSQYGDQN